MIKYYVCSYCILEEESKPHYHLMLKFIVISGFLEVELKNEKIVGKTFVIQ